MCNITDAEALKMGEVQSINYLVIIVVF